MAKVSAKDLVQENINNSTTTESQKLKDVITVRDGISFDAKGNIVTESGSTVLSPMQDGGMSTAILNDKLSGPEDVKVNANSDDYFTPLYHSYGIYKPYEIDYFNNRYRFGVRDPYNALTTCKEYLFFTKPDLNIYPRSNDATGSAGKQLAQYLQTQPYWLDLVSKNFEVVKCLQQSLDPRNNFNNLLGNMVKTTLEVPSMNATMIDSPTNMYGVSYQYRDSSEKSDDSYDFTLEFNDTKYLPVYHFFRAYEDYQRIKHHGNLPPWVYYTIQKVLYDQYSIYKFIVGEDGESIIYYAKAYGVKSKSLPRDVFSNTDFSNGLSYSIEFNAAFFEDMNPQILLDFNNLSRSYYESLPYQIDIHNHVLDRPDNRPAKAAFVTGIGSNIFDENRSSKAPGGIVPKLKWRGDAKY